jgi:cysteine desulfurase
VISGIEHPAVTETALDLGRRGAKIVTVDADERDSVGEATGRVNISSLTAALEEHGASLAALMAVNNETGVIQNVREAAEAAHRGGALFHCDAVQGFGKLNINVKTFGVDLLTASAHKIHGPKGIGFLYCKKGVSIAPFITGGGQERGMRSGTEAVPLIAGFMGAVKELGNLEENHKKISSINLYARELFTASGFIDINSPENALPYILNISVVGYRSETLLHFLESKNIFVSSGSACAKGEASYVLSVLGLDKKRSDSALRLSFSKDTTKEELALTLDALKEAVSRLRRSKI